METRNVTVSLPKDVLRRVKIIAAGRGTSISSLLAHALEEVVTRDDGYARARKRHGARLRRGGDLGTQGRARWRREDLHER